MFYETMSVTFSPSPLWRGYTLNFNTKNQQTFPTMKFVIIALAVAFVSCSLAMPQDKYTNKYDNIDLDKILNSDRLFNNFFNCLMDKGICTQEGRELKKILPDALQTECSKCSEKQKQGAEKVARYVIENKREAWNALQAKYDPKGIYYQKYKALAEERGVKL
ncbi:ejaculatory bulb-specific protein 3-like [Musca autumnalis]|uniref:ejaculatory bulb-specific protein 3-like n=1 Tax=Musca autumnalis TaxID=221902 RepID=UPI003CEF9010